MSDSYKMYVLRIGRLNAEDEVEIIDTRTIEGPDPSGDNFLPFFEQAWSLCKEHDMCYLLASTAKDFKRDGYTISPDQLKVQYARVEKSEGVLSEDFRNGETIEATFDPSKMLLQKAAEAN